MPNQWPAPGVGIQPRKLVPFRAGTNAAIVMVAGGGEYTNPNVARVYADLTGMTQCRLEVSLVNGAAANPQFSVQFSTDSGATWTDIGAILPPFLTNSQAVSPWSAIPVAARGEVLLRISSTGDGATSISASQIFLECKP